MVEVFSSVIFFLNPVPHTHIFNPLLTVHSLSQNPNPLNDPIRWASTDCSWIIRLNREMGRIWRLASLKLNEQMPLCPAAVDNLTLQLLDQVHLSPSDRLSVYHRSPDPVFAGLFQVYEDHQSGWGRITMARFAS